MLYRMSSKNINTKVEILKATWHLMEQQQGQDVSMGNIANAAGISRQAVYLHFASRTELMIATSNYVDEMKGLNQRLARLETANNGTELLEICVDVWGNYIPEIYGLAKAMLKSRDTDDAIAAAWNGNMQCLRDVCVDVINTLEKESKLVTTWSNKQAADMFWTLISIQNWEQLTIECGWSTEQYINCMKKLLKSTFIQKN